MKTLSNIELCNKYCAKQALIGEIFKFDIEESTDDVILMEYVENYLDKNIIEIPTFVTKISDGIGRKGKMFYGVRQSLKVIYRGTQIKSMDNMFDSYYGKELDLSCFNTSGVESMSAMFMNCRNIIKLDLSNFDTRKVKNMSMMFSTCMRLNELNIRNFKTTEVREVIAMFTGCIELNKVDLSSFDVTNIRDMSEMFWGSNLTCENTGLRSK